MLITDSGLHIWQTSTPEHPWVPGMKGHGPEFSYETLLADMEKAGVDRAILVPPSWEGYRMDYSLEAVRKHPKRFAVMGRIDLHDPQSRHAIETWKEKPGLLGVRLTFHHGHERAGFTDGTADWFWAAAERLDIPVMLTVSDMHAVAATIAERHPKLRLIIDHMGRVRGHKDDTLAAGLAGTIALAKYPNVFVKLTLVQTNSSQPYPYRNIHNTLRGLIDAFTPRRCFWGSDLSAMLHLTTSTYPQAVTLFTEDMKFLTADDLEWIMGKGLAECLPWPET